LPATGAPSILDANLGVAPEQRTPVQIRQIQVAGRPRMAPGRPRGHSSTNVPGQRTSCRARDLGILASESVFGDSVNYSAGIMGGVPDGPPPTTPTSTTDKDVVGRGVCRAVQEAGFTPLQGLSVGVSGSLGGKRPPPAHFGLQDDGQQTFFSYASTVVARRPELARSPQGEYRYAHSGCSGIRSLDRQYSFQARPSQGRVRNNAWQLAAAMF